LVKGKQSSFAGLIQVFLERWGPCYSDEKYKRIFEYFVTTLHGDEEALHDHMEDQINEENTNEMFPRVHMVEKEPPLDSIEEQIHEEFEDQASHGSIEEQKH